MTYAKTRKKTLEGVGLRPIRLGPAERINALRQLLPRSVFAEKKCAPRIEALVNYQVAYDPKNRTPLDHPKHDWSSHPATLPARWPCRSTTLRRRWHREGQLWPVITTHCALAHLAMPRSLHVVRHSPRR